MSFCKYNLEYNKILYLLLFTDVENGNELVSVLGKELNCAVINADLVFDPLQIAVAANKAVVNQYHKKMVTKFLTTEIIYNLSISKNITQSLQTFTAVGNHSNVIIATVTDGSNDAVADNIATKVIGQMRPVESLRIVCNTDLLKKAYDVKESSEDSILGLIITKISCLKFV